MRILYNNLLEASTNVATNQDANYPIENVIDTTLKTEFHSTTALSVITATLGTASTVSCLAFGNHNINAVQVTVTGSTTEVFNYTAADLRFSAGVTQGMVYFPAVTSVTEIEFDIASTTDAADLFIGGLSAGQCLQIDNFNMMPKIGFKSSGKRQKSRGGVTFNVPGTVLETFRCNFDAGSITNYNDRNAFFAVTQVYKPYFVDRWESSQELPVLFAQNTKDVSYTKGPEGLIFDAFRLELEECK